MCAWLISVNTKWSGLYHFCKGAGERDEVFFIFVFSVSEWLVVLVSRCFRST